MATKTIGIDPKMSISSNVRDVPKILDPGITDFFSRGYSMPRCVIEVIRIIRLYTVIDMPISVGEVSFDIISQKIQPAAEISKLSKKRRILGVTKSLCEFDSIFFLTSEPSGDLSLFKSVFPLYYRVFHFHIGVYLTSIVKSSKSPQQSTNKMQSLLFHLRYKDPVK